MRAKDRELFYSMMLEPALDLVSPFLEQELHVLNKILKNENHKLSTFVCIGSGPLMHKDAISKHNMNYIAVDPLIHDHVPSNRELENIECYPKCCADIVLPREKSNYLFGFTFNISAYILNIHGDIAKHTKAGDVLFLSGWSSTPEARQLREHYFAHVYASFPNLSDTDLVNDQFDIHSINPKIFEHYKRHEYHMQQYCNCLIVYL